MRTLTTIDLEKISGGAQLHARPGTGGRYLERPDIRSNGTIVSYYDYADKPLGFGLGEPRYQPNPHALK